MARGNACLDADVLPPCVTTALGGGERPAASKPSATSRYGRLWCLQWRCCTKKATCKALYKGGLRQTVDVHQHTAAVFTWQSLENLRSKRITCPASSSGSASSVSSAFAFPSAKMFGQENCQFVAGLPYLQPEIWTRLLITIGLPEAAVQNLGRRVVHLLPAVEAAALAQRANCVGERMMDLPCL